MTRKNQTQSGSENQPKRPAKKSLYATARPWEAWNPCHDSTGSMWIPPETEASPKRLRDCKVYSGSRIYPRDFRRWEREVDHIAKRCLDWANLSQGRCVDTDSEMFRRTWKDLGPLLQKWTRYGGYLTAEEEKVVFAAKALMDAFKAWDEARIRRAIGHVYRTAGHFYGHLRPVPPRCGMRESGWWLSPIVRFARVGKTEDEFFEYIKKRFGGGWDLDLES